MASLWYIDCMIDSVLPPNPSLLSFAKSAWRHISHKPRCVEFLQLIEFQNVANLAHIYECSSIWSTFGLGFSEKGGQDKCGIQCTATASEAKLLIP